MGRIEQTFQRLRDEDRKALVVYLTAGDPDPERSVEAALGAVEAGADVLEVGVPFSDPLADGPVIQRAMERALAGGGGLSSALSVVERIRARSEVPIVLFGYLNPLLHGGLDETIDRVHGAGVDGLLVVDVPPEESSELRSVVRARGLDWVALVAPTTTPDRLVSLAQSASGFVYLVSMTGVTGGALKDPAALSGLVEQIRAHSSLPVCVGFGIRDGATAAAAGRGADGVVVGSALIKALELDVAARSGIDQLRGLVSELRAGLDEGPKR